MVLKCVPFFKLTGFVKATWVENSRYWWHCSSKFAEAKNIWEWYILWAKQLLEFQVMLVFTSGQHPSGAYEINQCQRQSYQQTYKFLRTSENLIPLPHLVNILTKVTMDTGQVVSTRSNQDETCTCHVDIVLSSWLKIDHACCVDIQYSHPLNPLLDIHWPQCTSTKGLTYPRWFANPIVILILLMQRN